VVFRTSTERNGDVLRSQAQSSVTQMMRVFDYMKKSGAYPVVKALLPKKINAQPSKIFS
jgi:ferritin